MTILWTGPHQNHLKMGLNRPLTHVRTCIDMSIFSDDHLKWPFSNLTFKLWTGTDHRTDSMFFKLRTIDDRKSYFKWTEKRSNKLWTVWATNVKNPSRDQRYSSRKTKFFTLPKKKIISSKMFNDLTIKKFISFIHIFTFTSRTYCP